MANKVRVTATEPQLELYKKKCKYPAFVAGFGCVHKDTPVLTEFGFMRICDIMPLTRVVSWNEKSQKFQLSLSGGAFPKGRANLCRISTELGEFHATEHHQLFSSDCKYQSVEELSGRDSSLSVFQNLPLTSSELHRVLCKLDGQSFSRTDEDYLANYAISARQYGQQFLQEEGNDLFFVPSRDDVLKFCRSVGFSPCGNMDDLLGRELERIRLYLCCARIYMSRSRGHTLNPSSFAEDQISTSPLAHILSCLHKGQQSLLRFAPRHTTGQRSFDVRSYQSPYLGFAKIDSIKVLDGEQPFWDMQILGTNNYITADGAIHHNSGKSEALIISALMDSFEGGADSLIALYEPTFDLVRLILAPRLEEKLDEWGVRYRYNKSENIVYTSSGQMGDFVLRTLDNPARIVGYESFRAKIDELDTLKRDHAALAWEKIVARNRQRPKTYENTSGKPLNTVSVFTTPEGFRFVYEKWKKNPTDGYEMIQAPTRSNPYIPDDYIPSLQASYPPQLIDAYLEGQFVNLTAGSVYSQFDRTLNHTDETLNDTEPVYVGMDFNVGKMAATIGVKRNGEPRIVAEVVGGYDTPDMCRMLKERLWRYENGVYRKTRDIRVYPDASGGSRKSVNASETDIQILKDAGFIVKSPKANPPVKDRINAVNAMLCNADGVRKLLINTNTCPNVADSLEQQAWDKNGEPDKEGGFDHINDALGYFIHFEYPIVKRKLTISTVGGL